MDWRRLSRQHRVTLVALNGDTLESRFGLLVVALELRVVGLIQVFYVSCSQSIAIRLRGTQDSSQLASRTLGLRVLHCSWLTLSLACSLDELV